MSNQNKKIKEMDFTSSLKVGDKLFYSPDENSSENRELEVVRFLGKGEYTTVWQVKEDKGGNEPEEYAIKILSQHGTSTEDEIDFKNEIIKTKKLNTIFTNDESVKEGDLKEFFIVNIIENGKVSNEKNSSDQNLCFLMESADCSLKERINFFNKNKKEVNFCDNSVEGQKNSYFRMMWAFYCMRHLIAIYEKLISPITSTGFRSHCNIKPENILYFTDEKGRTPMLADFRFSEFNPEEGNENLEKRREKVLKKSVYAAPEVKNGKIVKPSADVYSLGIIFYELIKGDLFVSTGKKEYVVKKNIVEYFDKLDQYFSIKQSPKSPISFKVFIEKVLHSDPSKRYGTKKQMHKNEVHGNKNDYLYSALRDEFMDLEDKFMQSLKLFFKKKLLKEAMEYLDKENPSSKDIESALNKIDLFPESVRYCCIYEEKKGKDKVAKEGKDYAWGTCRFLIGGQENNLMEEMKNNLPKSNTECENLESINLENIKEVLTLLGNVLDECYGFLSHCHPHNYYRERLRNLLNINKEKGSANYSGSENNRLDSFDKLFLSIFKSN